MTERVGSSARKKKMCQRGTRAPIILPSWGYNLDPSPSEHSPTRIYLPLVASPLPTHPQLDHGLLLDPPVPIGERVLPPV
jgi:hypothetical protein